MEKWFVETAPALIAGLSSTGGGSTSSAPAVSVRVEDLRIWIRIEDPAISQPLRKFSNMDLKARVNADLEKGHLSGQRFATAQMLESRT